MAEDLRLKINNRFIEGWLNAQFTCGIERFPRAFNVEMTEKIDAKGKAQGIYDAGQPIEVYLGKDKVLTGYIDSYNPSISGTSHTITVSGRSKCQDISDCSADLFDEKGPYMQMSGVNAAQIAEKLVTPYDIKVIMQGTHTPLSIPLFNVNLGETSYQILEKVARYAGYLLYDDADGNLILGEVASEKKATGKLAQGVNILSAAASYNLCDRFGRYEFYSQSVQSSFDRTDAIPNKPDGDLTHGVARDPVFNKYKTPGGKERVRKLIQISDQTILGQPSQQLRADWEMNRRMGRSQRVQITTTSWRDEAGVLWKPNSLVKFTAPALRLTDKEWIIADVAFVKGAGGTLAQLTLMPQEAFKIEPFEIVPMQYDQVKAIQDAQNDRVNDLNNSSPRERNTNTSLNQNSALDRALKAGA